MKILSGHRINDCKLIADLHFFRGTTLEDDYDVHVEYTCPALDWSVWVPQATEKIEKQEVVERFDFLVLNCCKQENDLRIRIESVLSDFSDH